MSQTENTFKNSLRNFQSSRSNPIALPTTPSPLQSFRDSASNAFSNVSNSVQGYIPLGGNTEEEEDPWYQLSRVERVMAFALCLVLGIGCFALSFFFLPIFPGKFAATFTLSVALLRGPLSHMQHMLTKERIPFTVSYLGSMALTLYAALGLRTTLLTIIFAIIQIIALLWYVGSYIPGGISTLRYGTSYIGGRVVSILPI
ncbi:hypothetical protein INT47_011549 [Mucor saturninus]|uniref:Protein transport protein SFT2 n=1 Tax=Mucor saturninus TaxID=64648 RepID=A0A8H7QW42_9FUNG|nr:hypothetical protein INT47_011549 [Mucor saturninus]